MQQSEHQYREHSVSNNSSVITPQKKRIGGDFKKEVLVFSSIVKKGKVRQVNDKNCNEDKQQLISNCSYIGSKKQNKTIMKNSDQTELNYQLPKTVVTPCQDLFSLFIDHKLSAEYVQMMQKNKFKNLVIISVILPTGLMRKFSKFIDFSQQYRISIPQTPFTTDFIPLNPKNIDQNEANYVFWTYQVTENEQNLRNSMNRGNGRPSPSSVKSLKQMRNKRLGNGDQYNSNLRSLMVEMSQIVITTKKYIQNHSQLFLHASSDLTGSTYQLLSPVHLYELDIERTLLYFDEQEITQSIKSIPTPKYMENSSSSISQMKRKNTKVQDPSHIQIEPDEESYDFDGEERGKVYFIDKIQTARSREILADSQEDQHDEKLQFLEVLLSQSIFKRIENLLPFWIDNDSSYQIQQDAKKETKKRKGSFSHTTSELEKCQRFQLFLSQQIRSCLKRNYTYSMFCSSWIFLHFLTNFYQNNITVEQKKASTTIELSSKLHFSSYSGILMRSLKTFKRQIQLRFIQKVQNEHKDLTDEATLREILRNIKKDELIFIKKNLNSVQFPTFSNLKNDKSYVFSHQQTSINKEYLTEIQHELINFMDKHQEDIYFQNNKQAVIFNQKILESEYERIVQHGFKRQILKKKSSSQSSNPSLESDERSFINVDSIPKKKISSEIVSGEIQKDFNDFIDAYWTKGVKVSSQLKTFNDFMEKCKKQYFKNINLLTKQKKSQQKEDQQRENKKRTIKLLEMEIFKLQNKKREVKQKNKIIKKQAKNIEEKIQLLEKNEFKIQRQNIKSGQRQGKSMEYSRTEKFIQQSDRKKGNFQNSETEEKRFSKSPGLSFQIQNKRKSRNNKDSEKMSPNKFSKNQDRKIKRTSFERNLQAQKQVKTEQKSKKNCCFNICCVIM